MWNLYWHLKVMLFAIKADIIIFSCYHDINTAWPLKLEVTLDQLQATCGADFCTHTRDADTLLYLVCGMSRSLADRPFNSFNTEENRAPLANRTLENRAVNLRCGGKWTDRSGGVSSVCEQRCISVDTPHHFGVLGNLAEKSAESRCSYHLVIFQNKTWDQGVIQT